jgi:hypothetical protein
MSRESGQGKGSEMTARSCLVAALLTVTPLVLAVPDAAADPATIPVPGGQSTPGEPTGPASEPSRPIVTGPPGRPATAGPAGGRGWRLVHRERFGRDVDDAATPWTRDIPGPGSLYDLDEYDEDGRFFEAVGGPGFRTQLAATHLYRKSFTFGGRGWLTAELAARDTDRDGRPDRPPSLSTERVPGYGPAALLREPSHQGGIIIRSTRALPSAYRVEMTLVTLDFGGQRGGSWDYPDGRINGYSPAGCKTNHPWANGGDFSRPECEWFDVRTDSNGFYFLGIMDYPRTAPHNNIFIHTHRKVAMDAYNRYKYTGAGLRYCNPATGQYEPYAAGTGNGVNMIFMTDKRRYTNQPGTDYLMNSECGFAYGGAIVSQVDLRPELMPGQRYKYAIERVDGGYTMEVSGVFAHVGQATFRYHRKFVQDGMPIWHYNQTAAEYDGRFNTDWTYPGPFGEYVHRDVWPAGSAYPDYLLIGDPHINFYEGSARVGDIRLYVPR